TSIFLFPWLRPSDSNRERKWSGNFWTEANCTWSEKIYPRPEPGDGRAVIDTLSAATRGPETTERPANIGPNLSLRPKRDSVREISGLAGFSPPRGVRIFRETFNFPTLSFQLPTLDSQRHYGFAASQ